MMFEEWHIEAKSQAFFTTQKTCGGWAHKNSKEKKRCPKQQRNTKCRAICYNRYWWVLRFGVSKLEGLGYCDLNLTQHPFGGIDTRIGLW